MVPHDYLLNLSLLILGPPPIVQVLVSRMAIAHIGTHISSLNVVCLFRQSILYPDDQGVFLKCKPDAAILNFEVDSCLHHLISHQSLDSVLLSSPPRNLADPDYLILKGSVSI